MVERNLELVMVLEDDVRFEFDFRNTLEATMKEAHEKSSTVNWDLMLVDNVVKEFLTS